MKTRVLDSWPILEWINAKQPATDALRKLLEQSEAGHARLLMSAINVGEVYYFLRKHYSDELAQSWKELSGTLPVTIDVPTMEEIWDAAVLKACYPIAYADAFAVALAHKCHCPLLTGDPELRSIPDLELDWIGRVET